jgi:hypothetical protein
MFVCSLTPSFLIVYDPSIRSSGFAAAAGIACWYSRPRPTKTSLVQGCVNTSTSKIGCMHLQNWRMAFSHDLSFLPFFPHSNILPLLFSVPDLRDPPYRILPSTPKKSLEYHQIPKYGILAQIRSCNSFLW